MNVTIRRIRTVECEIANRRKNIAIHSGVY